MSKKYNLLQMIFYPIIYVGLTVLILLFIFRDYTFNFKVDIGSEEDNSAIFSKSYDSLTRLDLMGYDYSSADDPLVFNSTSIDANENYSSYNDVLLAARINDKSSTLSTLNDEVFFSFTYELTGVKCTQEISNNSQFYWEVFAYNRETGKKLDTASIEQEYNYLVTIDIGDRENLENTIIVFSASPIERNNEINLAKYLLDVTESNSKISLIKLSDLLF